MRLRVNVRRRPWAWSMIGRKSKCRRRGTATAAPEVRATPLMGISLRTAQSRRSEESIAPTKDICAWSEIRHQASRGAARRDRGGQIRVGYVEMSRRPSTPGDTLLPFLLAMGRGTMECILQAQQILGPGPARAPDIRHPPRTAVLRALESTCLIQISV